MKGEAGTRINLWVDSEDIGKNFMSSLMPVVSDTALLQVRVIRYAELFKGTPLFDFYPTPELDQKKSDNPIKGSKYGSLGKQNLSDAVRLAILHK